MAHIATGVFGAARRQPLRRRRPDRAGPPPASTGRSPPRGGLALLDHWHDAWIAGVRGLGEDGLERPSGPAEGPFAAEPLATLVLHINREALHHSAEILLLLDLYAHTHGAALR